jgi:hypothetical protein
MTVNFDDTVHVSIDLSDGGSPRRSAIPHMDKQRTSAELREFVVRLRRQGWSYRRISTELGIPYVTVNLWLDGPEAMPAAPAASERAVAAPVVKAVVTTRAALANREPAYQFSVAPELVLENRRLAERLDGLAEDQESLRRELKGVEGRLREAIKDLSNSLMERMSRLFKD